VETGLDILEFPVILFHETGYSLHTLRQASRRSWRIGQKRNVEIKFFAYQKTMQEICIRLMGNKLLVALAMEGKFASEGLQAINGDDDMLTAMARELVEQKGIGESADSIWRKLAELQPAARKAVEVGTPTETATKAGVATSNSSTLEPVLVPTLVEEACQSSLQSPRKTVAGLQLSLF
jgi:hypothetical protein